MRKHRCGPCHTPGVPYKSVIVTVCFGWGHCILAGERDVQYVRLQMHSSVLERSIKEKDGVLWAGIPGEHNTIQRGGDQEGLPEDEHASSNFRGGKNPEGKGSSGKEPLVPWRRLLGAECDSLGEEECEGRYRNMYTLTLLLCDCREF